MTILEIVLIVIGFVFVVVSFFISGKMNQTTTNVTVDEESLQRLLSENEKVILERINSKAQSQADEIFEQSKRQMEKVSNEKIMAVSDLGDQVLEKINNNHTEVVFLYDMLNDKETELKDMLREVGHESKVLKQLKTPETERKTVNNQAAAIKKKDIDVSAKGIVKEQKENRKIVEQLKGYVADDQSDDMVSNGDNKDRILYMYQNGSSIVEISKELGIGQGEVQLVINLFQGGSV